MNPLHPLAGVRTRLENAQRRIGDVKSAINDFDQKNPFAGRAHLDPTDPRRGSLNVIRLELPPADLAIACGEALQQLRSSLDNLITQSIVRTSPGSRVDKSYFRVCVDDAFLDPKAHKDKHSSHTGKLQGISVEALQLHEENQPCKRADRAERAGHPLAVLETLNKVDKHRDLIGIGTLCRLDRLQLGPAIGTMKITFHQAVLIATSNAGQGTLVDFDRTESGPLDMDFAASSQIAFKDIGSGVPAPVVPTLNSLLEYVTQLVEEFGTRCPEFKL